MQLIRGIHNLRPEHHGCVLSIGNFDGVHLGHKAVLQQLQRKAEELAAIDRRIELVLFPECGQKRKTQTKSVREWDRILGVGNERGTKVGRALAS